MLERLKSFFHPDHMGSNDARAIIKLAILVMYADMNLDSDEIKRIDALIDEHPFTGPVQLGRFVGAARHDVIEACEHGENGIRAFIQTQCGSLQGDKVKRDIVAACANIATADGELASEEVSVLNMIRQELNSTA